MNTKLYINSECKVTYNRTDQANNTYNITQYVVCVWRTRVQNLLSNNLLKLKFDNLSNIKKLDVFFTKEGNTVRLNLPDTLQEQIKIYLQKPKEIENKYKWKISTWEYFDCWDFVCFLKKWGKHGSLHQIEDNWKYEIWDVIWIFNQKTEVQHYALYIWEDLFLSKYWTQPFVISKLEGMHNAYGTNESRKVIGEKIEA